MSVNLLHLEMSILWAIIVSLIGMAYGLGLTARLILIAGGILMKFFGELAPRGKKA